MSPPPPPCPAEPDDPPPPPPCAPLAPADPDAPPPLPPRPPLPWLLLSEPPQPTTTQNIAGRIHRDRGFSNIGALLGVGDKPLKVFVTTQWPCDRRPGQEKRVLELIVSILRAAPAVSVRYFRLSKNFQMLARAVDETV
jgi:hypothetical protein